MNMQKKEECPKYYEFFNSVKIISGYKALDNIASELDMLGARKPIIITDKGVSQAGLIDHVVNSFGGTQVAIGALYDDTPVDSSIVAVN
ncbi:MAG TPA: iron-containing alcohol dehydrogenase, partial [Smithella sp.]|nr:iron-containing alcohol dehydrogenase [Smithella sp.]